MAVSKLMLIRIVSQIEFNGIWNQEISFDRFAFSLSIFFALSTALICIINLHCQFALTLKNLNYLRTLFKVLIEQNKKVKYGSFFIVSDVYGSSNSQIPCQQPSMNSQHNGTFQLNPNAPPFHPAYSVWSKIV